MDFFNGKKKNQKISLIYGHEFLCFTLMKRKCISIYHPDSCSFFTFFPHQNVTSIQVKHISSSENQHFTNTFYLQLLLISRAQQSWNSDYRIADVGRQSSYFLQMYSGKNNYKDCHKIGVTPSLISTNFKCFLATLLQRVYCDLALWDPFSKPFSRIVSFLSKGWLGSTQDSACPRL